MQSTAVATPDDVAVRRSAIGCVCSQVSARRGGIPLGRRVADAFIDILCLRRGVTANALWAHQIDKGVRRPPNQRAEMARDRYRPQSPGE
jgi:hypothetical protein